MKIGYAITFADDVCEKFHPHLYVPPHAASAEDHVPEQFFTRHLISSAGTSTYRRIATYLTLPLHYLNLARRKGENLQRTSTVWSEVRSTSAPLPNCRAASHRPSFGTSRLTSARRIRSPRRAYRLPSSYCVFFFQALHPRPPRRSSQRPFAAN